MKSNKPISVQNIIWCKLSDTLYGSTRTKPTLPNEIGQYKLVEELSHNGYFAIGIYEYSDKYVICKYWKGIRKDIFYYTLLNEIYSYIDLQNVTDKKIRFPKLIDTRSNDAELYMLIEYIDGKPKQPMSIEEFITVLFDSTKLLRKLGKENSLVHLSKRGPLSYVILSLPLIILALKNNLTNIGLLLRSYILFIKCVPSLFRIDYNALTHKDLNLNNIIKQGDINYIIDLQYLVKSSWIMDIAATTRFYIADNEFMSKLNDIINDKFSTAEKRAYKAFCIYYSLMGLSDKRFSNKRTAEFILLLEAINNYA